jgi:acetyl esterase/lipase
MSVPAPGPSKLFFCLLLALTARPVQSQEVIPLWGDEPPPFSKAHTVEEYEAPCWGEICVHQVVNPTLTLYLPEGKSNGAAVVILPGGGYEVEAVYHEGYEIAQALAGFGTVAAVLKYRIPNPETASKPEQAPLAHVRQALKLLRARQAELGFSAERFGVLGFSAGSHLAAAVSVNRKPLPALNPDFSILVYGVTRLTAENREWLENTLYHHEMTAEELVQQTLLERVDKHAPPAFLVHAFDDDTCHYTESTLYAEALTRHGVPAEIHLFASGGHGFGPGRDEDGTSQWLGLAANWLDRLEDS